MRTKLMLLAARPLEEPTLTLKALLNPEAKKPPKGAKREANTDRAREWSTAGYK